MDKLNTLLAGVQELDKVGCDNLCSDSKEGDPGMRNDTQQGNVVQAGGLNSHMTGIQELGKVSGANLCGDSNDGDPGVRIDERLALAMKRESTTTAIVSNTKPL